MRQTACTFAIPAVLLAAMSFAAGAAFGRARRANAGNGSELRALREALAAHAEEAVRLDHAFRTPIGAAAAALELLETSGDDPALQAQARQVIARQLGRMTALTETLRETAQRLGG
jgi:signal transduction histidine kinase